MRYETHKTKEFEEWLDSLPPKHREQVAKRIRKIEEEGYFGDVKDLKIADLDTGMYELKWKIGTRAYFIYMQITSLLFLWGGNKNGQSKDIQKAKNLFERLRSKES